MDDPCVVEGQYPEQSEFGSDFCAVSLTCLSGYPIFLVRLVLLVIVDSEN